MEIWSVLSFFLAGADRLLRIFGAERKALRWAPAARELFGSYSTFFQIQVAAHRARGDVDRAAAKGAAPWKLGQLTALLNMWDIFIGQREGRVRARKLQLGRALTQPQGLLSVALGAARRSSEAGHQRELSELMLG